MTPEPKRAVRARSAGLERRRYLRDHQGPEETVRWPMGRDRRDREGSPGREGTSLVAEGTCCQNLVHPSGRDHPVPRILEAEGHHRSCWEDMGVVGILELREGLLGELPEEDSGLLLVLRGGLGPFATSCQFRCL